ncbi:helix-turn-helix domain-containing protein [Streptomyces albidoflavus]|uniref:Helix-turn-helix transcriptional regulator n=1 Tax=Streptomyces koyangensis TaxID=188770 RepID=A0ABX7EFD3_9ACTN|nr:helix-turn-helix transcriptional regulator [Streptomyces koyangensis]QRF03202.1 helix-turn-helix transcriptional regulator [Streptomyces koyangensis]
MPAPKSVDPTASLAALLGARIRRLRRAKGWSQTELAAKGATSQGRLAQMELGRETPSQTVCQLLDQALDADGELLALWAHIERTPYPDWSRAFMRFEQRATRMRKYMAATVPGLLQTESYVRALLTAARPSVGGALESLVRARLERRLLLTGESPPYFWAILDESVLRRPIGAPEVMREQLTYLLHMQETERVSLQVLPFSAGVHPALGGSVTVLSFDRRPDVAYLESSHSGELIDDPEAAAGYGLAFDQLHAQALSPHASAAMIRNVLEGSYGVTRVSRRRRRSVAQEQLQQHAGWGLRRGPRRPARPGSDT